MQFAGILVKIQGFDIASIGNGGNIGGDSFRGIFFPN